METINFSQLPVIPPADIARGVEIAANATNANGQTYVGRAGFADVAEGGGTTLQVYFTSLTLNAAQIISGLTTPIPFGLTVPAGYYVLPLSGYAVLNYNSVTFDTGVNLGIRHVGSTERIGVFANILAQTADGQSVYTAVSGTVPNLLVTGADIEAVASADGTVGDSSVTVYLVYTLIQQ